MRNSRITWSIAGGAALALIAGVSVAVAVNRGPEKAPTAAPEISVTPSIPPSPSPSAGADIKGPLDLVLIGVDTRVSIPGYPPHADTLMLMHVEADLKSAYLYSLPRDLRVDIPAFPKSGFKGGRHKITEAMSRGAAIPGSEKKDVQQGYELLTKTLSAYTGIKTFQGGAILNFGGLDKLVDQLGGIDIVVDQKVKSRHRKPDGSMRPLSGTNYSGPQATYNPGNQHLVGWQALDYARQRYGLPNGDYDRQRHHRQLVEAIFDKGLSQGLSDPAKLTGVITALGETLEYVGGRTPIEYAYALRDLTTENITTVSLPGEGVGSGGNYLGEQLEPEGKAFVKAVAGRTHVAYLAAHPKLVDK
ncbi:LCP family protein [Actinoplanes couchii]|uniref:Cell envelope-related transcriptional attenuator domain-containing protein n=1 Tax=Actinoplanes couchii TaxID=403638 RepID=A0ABQ3XBZ9_9ACTN|nr:LCP family protein [Actinoplanes couchii]MDR6323526.1 LCP family protein required for cell wall assembly [Actinoplanes couchii]GID56042.1 hypothetical protein Aco03nite_044460 [Actinoplanes couchii]